MKDSEQPLSVGIKPISSEHFKTEEMLENILFPMMVSNKLSHDRSSSTLFPLLRATSVLNLCIFSKLFIRIGQHF
jgi:hypothetical protein